MRRVLGGVFAVIALLAGVVAAGEVLRDPQSGKWPGNVALLGVDGPEGGYELRWVGLMSPDRRVVVFGTTTMVVEVPGSGYLTASRAFQVGGETAIRDALGLLLGIDVPYSYVGESSSFADLYPNPVEARVPGRYADAMQDALDQAISWPIVNLRGDPMRCDAGSCMRLTESSVDSAVNALNGTRAGELWDGET